MFGTPQSPKKRITFGWYVFLFIIGLGAVLFSVQSSFRARPSADLPPTSVSQADESSTSALEKPQNESQAESFLPKYDPKATSFLTSSPEDERPLWISGGEFLLKLLLVIGLIYLALAGLRWLQKGRQQLATGGAAIRVLETTGLAPGRSLHLVVVGEKTLLIGATDHHLSVLAELADVVTPVSEETSEFEETLTQVTNRTDVASSREWQAAFDNLRGSVQRIRQGMSR